MNASIVWLDNSRRRGRPIRRRWRLYIGRQCVLSLPLRSVEWSR